MANPNQSGWDWPYILYAGRVWLRYTEEEVWQLTPRQFKAQMSVHEDVMSMKNGGQSKRNKSAPTGFIDQIEGW